MNLLLAILEQIAIWGAGAASLSYGYQPKTPECLLD